MSGQALASTMSDPHSCPLSSAHPPVTSELTDEREGTHEVDDFDRRNQQRIRELEEQTATQHEQMNIPIQLDGHQSNTNQMSGQSLPLGYPSAHSSLYSSAACAAYPFSSSSTGDVRSMSDLTVHRSSTELSRSSAACAAQHPIASASPLTSVAMCQCGNVAVW